MSDFEPCWSKEKKRIYSKMAAKQQADLSSTEAPNQVRKKMGTNACKEEQWMTCIKPTPDNQILQMICGREAT